MMRYAESPECRVRWMRRYFGDEEEGEPCTRCDNCTHPIEVTSAPPPRAPRKRRATPPPAPPPFATGATVTHARFGAGEVLEIGEHSAVVAFAGGAKRRIALAFLTLQQAAA